MLLILPWIQSLHQTRGDSVHDAIADAATGIPAGPGSNTYVRASEYVGNARRTIGRRGYVDESSLDL